jgi:2-methylcitrate dehydratase PrpD
MLPARRSPIFQANRAGSCQSMLRTAVGYTVQSRFVDHANLMTSGFDHTTQLALSHNAAAGRLLGLSEQQIANAIAMAAVSDAAFAVVRAKPLSQWKGLTSSQSTLGSSGKRMQRMRRGREAAQEPPPFPLLM